MKVIEQGHVNPFPITINCVFCQSKLEADFEDVKAHTVKGGGGNIRDTYDVTEYFIECPVCGSQAALTDADFLNAYHTERIIRERGQRLTRMYLNK